MAKQINEGTFPSTGGLYPIHYIICRDDAVPPVAILQIAHGMVEHMGCYEETIDAMIGKGYIVVGNDHTGHGKSVNSTADLGYFAPKDGDETMISDMHTLHAQMQEAFPALPYFLLGHSMGSFLAKVYVTRYPEELAGVIFCGTGNYPAFFAHCNGLVKAAFRCLPEKKTCAFAYQTGLRMMNLPFRKHAKTGGEFLCSREEVIQNHIDDPLCGYAYTFAGYRDLASLVTKISGMTWAQRVPTALPILLLSGKQDPIGKKGRGIYQTVRLLEAAGSHPEAILYENGRHEILSDTIRETVYHDLDTWMKKTIGQETDSSVCS